MDIIGTDQKGIAEEIREKKIAEIQRHLQRMHSGVGHDSIVYLLFELSRIQQENERITKENKNIVESWNEQKEEIRSLHAG